MNDLIEFISCCGFDCSACYCYGKMCKACNAVCDKVFYPAFPRFHTRLSL